jgi:transposase
MLATRPVDFRRGAHSLAGLAAASLGQDPFDGALIVFRAKRADRVKISLWDGSGLVLIWKQIQDGAFRWPPIVDGVMKLTSVEYATLFDGLDWGRIISTPKELRKSKRLSIRGLTALFGYVSNESFISRSYGVSA